MPSPQFIDAVGSDRLHNVYRFTDQIYKIVQFNRWSDSPLGFCRDSEKFDHYDHKLDASVSRAKRTILELALCNDWQWFCTLTIAKDNYDRKNLFAWRDSLTQWIRDQRKRGFDLKYLLIPEQHEDGSWHAHGFLSGLPVDQLITFKDMDKAGYRSPGGRRLPYELRNSDYYNWPAYQKKFGICSLGAIKSHVAASFYITKYMTKDKSFLVGNVGLHLYYCSRGLNRAVKHCSFIDRDPYIDSLLVNKYDFCSTGFTHLDDDLDIDFCSEFSHSMVKPVDVFAHDNDAADYLEFEQLFIGGFYGK